MKASQVLAAITAGEFTDAELRQMNEVLVARLNATRQAMNAIAKVTLKVGMKVKVNHPKLAGRELILTDIKRSKASVRPAGEMFGGYNVPLSLVEAI
jgi:hypothetical protein